MIYGFKLKEKDTHNQLGEVSIGYPFPGTPNQDLYFKVDGKYYLVTSIVFYPDRDNMKTSIGTTTIIGELILKESDVDQIQYKQLNS